MEIGSKEAVRGSSPLDVAMLSVVVLHGCAAVDRRTGNGR
jgi:hypothetical protein